MKNTTFSVLCSLYHKESPVFLDNCLESIEKQSLTPSEVVIVHDGPLTQPLYKILDKWRKTLPIVELKLDQNVGLGEALNKGLALCKHDLIVRVDTDDINMPNRFYEQVNFMLEHPDVAVSSCHIEEFDKCISKPTGLREVPLDNIRKRSLKKNPINHMACIFRKEKIIASGGYKHLTFMEDYYLWLRLLANDHKIKNINKVLVKARAGNAMLNRRRGLIYTKSELKLMKNIYKIGLTKNPFYFFYFSARGIARLLPAGALQIIYKKNRK